MLTKPSSCNGCVLQSSGTGFMEVSGTGSNGVLIIGEALGADEAAAGKPFVGKAGFTLDKLLQRGGLNREEFRISNVVYCQPQQNKLAGMWYMQDAINHCAPNLDRAIAEMKPKAIVTLGVTAFQRVLPEIYAQYGVGLLDSKKNKGVVGYTFWSQRYGCWVTPTVHPSFILRGQTAWAQSLIFCLQRAVENATNGYSYEEGDYTLDCTPAEAHEWVNKFEEYYENHPDVFLSTDIETPGKDADEAELDLESNSDYIILRCGYSYRDGHALSIPWDGPYRLVHERLLNHKVSKCWWNGSYDMPRIISQGITIGGASHDGMDAWHILNSDLKKSLNFVTPWFRKNLRMWKHLSGSQPAFYNAVDADAAGSNLRGTIALLKKHNLYRVYEEFVLELDPVYAEMTRAGMPIDASMRFNSAQMLTEKKLEVLNRINSLVPDQVKPITPKEGYKKPPKDTTGLTEVTFNGILNTYCTNCGVAAPKKAHFKSKPTKQCNGCGAKWTAAHVKPSKKKPNPCEGQQYSEVEANPCAAATTVERLEGEKRFAKMGKFVPSTKGILKYQQVKKHPLIYVGKGDEKKPTTDEKAIKKLMGRHPEDKVYPSVLEYRELQTISSRYIGYVEDGKLAGGFPTGRDGNVHGIFRHSPSTLRSSMVSPNLQNIPRGDDSDIQKLVKQMFVAPPGFTFLERDFGGIEAVLVGYEAGSQAVTRLAKIDLHSYFTAYNLNRMGILPAADLPQLRWSDADLAGALHGIKKRFKDERQVGKKVIHSANYHIGPKHMSEDTPQWFPRPKDAAMVLNFYYELFPEILRWHERLCLQVDKSAVVQNAFGHTHRFYQVLNWEKQGNDWTWSFGDDSKRLIAFNPQSNAALIGKRALKNCFNKHPETLAKWLRLFIHDAMFLMVPTEHIDLADELVRVEMEAPIPEMRLDPSWGMGDYLTIGSESKRGQTWASMK